MRHSLALLHVNSIILEEDTADSPPADLPQFAFPVPSSESVDQAAQCSSRMPMLERLCLDSSLESTSLAGPYPGKQKESKKSSSPTRIRTMDTTFKVSGDNHFTIGDWLI